MKVGRKPRAATRNLFFVKKKAVQKTDSSDDYFEENNWLAATMILKKINWLMETRMSTLKKI